MPDELVAAVASMEEAEMVAAYYGITLESYAYGVAVYTTATPQTAVRQSQTYSIMPTLYENRIYTISETEITDTTAQYHHEEIHTTAAWGMATGEGVTVAIIDTGVDIDHVALTHAISEDRVYNSHSESEDIADVNDDHGHGTHVAGIVAAYSEDDGIYGVAPDADLMIIKANMDNTGDFTVASLVRGINYAVDNGADIINMSLGVSYASGAYDIEQEAIDNAVAAGVTVICAAGNYKESHAGYPAAYDSAIAVSAVGEGFAFASSYSNYGSEIDVAAPGTYIYSTCYNGGYVLNSGTSMACPVVSGVAALIVSANPDEDYTPAELRTILQETAMDAGDLGQDDYYGYGIVNAYSAVLGVENLYQVSYYDDGALLATTYVAPGDCLIEPNEPESTYLFASWTTSSDEDTTWDFSTPVTADLVLTAQWEPVSVITDTNTTSVTVDVTPEIAAESEQVILALYENGQLKAVTLAAIDDASITATCQGIVDEATVFVVDTAGQPLTSQITYALGN